MKKEMKRTGVYIEKTDADRLEEMSIDVDRSKNKIIQMALKSHLDKWETDNNKNK